MAEVQIDIPVGDLVDALIDCLNPPEVLQLLAHAYEKCAVERLPERLRELSGWVAWLDAQQDALTVSAAADVDLAPKSEEL